MINNANHLKIICKEKELVIPIRYTKRKTIGLSYNSHSATFLVRAPLKTSYPTLVHFIESKRDWVKKYDQLTKNTLNNRLLYKEQVPLLGKLYKIRRSDQLDIDHSLQNQEIIFRDSKQDTKNLLKKWYKGVAYHILNRRFQKCYQHYSEVMKSSRFIVLTIKAMKKRLGSMNNETDHMILNEKLVQLPTHLIDTVIFHELAHIHHPHHKKSFYDELLMICPLYKDHHQELKEFTFWNIADFTAS